MLLPQLRAERRRGSKVFSTQVKAEGRDAWKSRRLLWFTSDSFIEPLCVETTEPGGLCLKPSSVPYTGQ